MKGVSISPVCEPKVKYAKSQLGMSINFTFSAQRHKRKREETESAGGRVKHEKRTRREEKSAEEKKRERAARSGARWRGRRAGKETVAERLLEGD